MLLTNFCNRRTTRTPVNRSIPEREAFTVTDRHRAPLRPTREDGPQRFLAASAPSCLAATRPQVDVRLTALIELRLHRSQPYLVSEKNRAPLRAVLPCPRRCRPRARLAVNASDAPCRAPRVPGNPGLCEEPEPLPPSSRQRRRLSRLRASFIDNVLPRTSAFAGRSLDWEPATNLSA